MTYDERTETYTLTTGRKLIGVNGGVLGLAAKPKGGELFEGFDGSIAGTWEGDAFVPFSLLERRELAETMIARWRLWAEQEPDQAVIDSHA